MSFRLFHTATTKRVSATQERKNVSESKVSYHDIIVGGPEPVKKAADQVSFEFRNGMLVRVQPEMDLTRPKPKDATVEPQWPASNFPGSASIVNRPVRAGQDSLTPPGTYAYVEPSEQDVTSAGTLVPNFLNVDEAEDTAPREMYSPSTPGKNPADGPVPPDFDEDDTVPWTVEDSERPDNDKPAAKRGVRMGNGYVLKSEFKR